MKIPKSAIIGSPRINPTIPPAQEHNAFPIRPYVSSVFLIFLFFIFPQLCLNPVFLLGLN